MRSNRIIKPQFLWVHYRILSLSGTGHGALKSVYGWQESWLAPSGLVEMMEKARDQMLAGGGGVEAEQLRSHAPQQVGEAAWAPWETYL